MHIIENQLYHIYNQGNNKQLVFSENEDCLDFLKRVKKHVLPTCDVLAYCLMPNHFHFLVSTSKNSASPIQLGNIQISELSNAFRMLTSQYTLAYNNKHGRSGSLFRQKTKAKLLDDFHKAFICFQYIHQNPVKAELVDKMEDYEFSSYRDFAKLRNGTLCKQNLAHDYLDIDLNNFVEQSDGVVINDRVLKSILS